MTAEQEIALITLATETMKACKILIESLTETTQPQALIGLVKAGELVNRSHIWLRRKMERGELTGYQTGKGGRWQVDPEVLLSELKMRTSKNCRPTIRRRSAQ